MKGASATYPRGKAQLRASPTTALLRLRRLAASLFQLFGARLGKHVPRLGHLNQLLPVLWVAHLTGHFAAFSGVRFVFGDLFHPSSRLKCRFMLPKRSEWATFSSVLRERSIQKPGPRHYGTRSFPQFSPYVGRDFPTRVLWGDTHLHIAVSVDAGTMCRVGQEDAYRFARGEEITTTHGLRAKLSRPLDFLVIADHAEMYGLMPQLLSGDQEILSA